MPKQRKAFEAEVFFADPNAAFAGIEALEALGFDFEIDHGAIDDHSAAVFGSVSGLTELDENEIGAWLVSIIWPHGGDVIAWSITALRMRRLRAQQN
jgi:hypothetical protein